MNFTPFGNPFPGTTTTIPSISQFTTTTAPQVSTNVQDNVVVNRYQPQHQQQQQQQQQGTTTVNMTHFNQPTLPVATATTITKFRTGGTVDDPQGDKYNGHLVTIGTAGAVSTITSNSPVHQQYTTIPAYTQQTEDKRLVAAATAYPQNTITASTSASAAASATIGIATGGQATSSGSQQLQQQITAPQELTQDLCNAILQQQGVDTKRVLENTSWQSLTPGTTVADYLSHLPANTLPLSLHHFLKYSAETIKKENQNVVQTGPAPTLGINTIGGTTTTTITIPQQQLQTVHQTAQMQIQQQQIQQQNTSATGDTINVVASTSGASATATTTITTTSKKKKRKKRPKECKPKLKPGEIRLTTALDGSPLYMCPECQVAYPEPDLLEIHLVGHNLERRYICDICQAALKRKDHLTRHKQSHNPERPFICTVCLKAFKRKEQLSLHFVIHSGEKRHLCQECGKGFYRKDHLRKHTRSHIARRVKAELSMQNQSENGTSMLQPVVTPSTLAAVAHANAQQQQIQQQQQANVQPVQQQHEQQVPQQQQTQQPQHAQMLN